MDNRIATINLPILTNDGFPQKGLEDVLSSVVELFGGYTKSKVEGAWKSPNGRIYIEPMWAVQIAAEWTPRNLSVLMGLAKQTARNLGQECIFVVLPDGICKFVEPTPHAIAAE